MIVAQLVLSLDVGGQERLIIDLADRLQRRGIKSPVIVLTRGALIEEAQHKGIETIALGKPDGLRPGMVLRLRQLIRRHRIDVMHTHNFAPLIYGTPASRLAGIGTINTRHGRAALSAPQVLWRFTDAVVAVSEDARTELLKHNRVPPAKVRVILNGIDVDAFTARVENRAAARRVFGIPPEAPVVGTVGRLSPEKDQATLLRAFREASLHVPDAHLVVIGGGPLESGLRDLAVSLDLAQRVHFLGFRSDVSALLPGLDLFVLPSLMEGVSLTLLEAMAATLPVVATDVGGNPEVVLHEETGYIVGPGNVAALSAAITAVLSDRDRARRFGEMGRARVGRVFSLDGMVDAYVALYEQVRRS